MGWSPGAEKTWSHEFLLQKSLQNSTIHGLYGNFWWLDENCPPKLVKVRRICVTLSCVQQLNQLKCELLNGPLNCNPHNIINAKFQLLLHVSRGFVSHSIKHVFDGYSSPLLMLCFFSAEKTQGKHKSSEGEEIVYCSIPFCLLACLGISPSCTYSENWDLKLHVNNNPKNSSICNFACTSRLAIVIFRGATGKRTKWEVRKYSAKVSLSLGKYKNSLSISGLINKLISFTLITMHFFSALLLAMHKLINYRKPLWRMMCSSLWDSPNRRNQFITEKHEGEQRMKVNAFMIYIREILHFHGFSPKWLPHSSLWPEYSLPFRRGH